MTLIDIFTDFIEKDIDLDDKVVYLSKRSIIDCFGAMILGSDTDIVRQVKDLASLNGNSTIIGFGTGYSAKDAAFVNGISGHELELDDTSSSNLGHPTVAVLPALLAICEERNCSGLDLIKSFVIATEVECKIGRICARELHKRGWHCSSVTGVIGAAAGCGFLLKLDSDKMKACLGIAASLASGVRENFGTSTKSIHIGKTSENGVVAALLAEKGITSSIHALDGKEGYLTLYTAKSYEPFGKEFAETLGNNYDICSPGFTLKRYPSCSSTHRAIDAFIDVVEENSINYEDIDSISFGLSEAALRELVTPNPTTGDEAKFSIGFQIALLMLNIENAPKSYNESIIKDERVQEIIAETSMYHEPKYDGLPADMGVGPALVKIVMKDGKEYTKERVYPVGHLTDPMSDDDIKKKFINCSKNIIGEIRTEQLYNTLLNIENISSVREIMKLCY